MEKKRILMIDDEPSFTRLIKLNLEQIGPYDVRVENDASGRSRPRRVPPASRAAGRHHARDGCGEVAAQIRADPQLKDTPIVFLTAVVSGKPCPPRANNRRNTFLAKR